MENATEEQEGEPNLVVDQPNTSDLNEPDYAPIETTVILNNDLPPALLPSPRDNLYDPLLNPHPTNPEVDIEDSPLLVREISPTSPKLVSSPSESATNSEEISDNTDAVEDTFVVEPSAAASPQPSLEMIDTIKIKNELLGSTHYPLHSKERDDAGVESPSLRKEFESLDTEELLSSNILPSKGKQQISSSPSPSTNPLDVDLSSPSSSSPSSPALVFDPEDPSQLFHDPLLNPENRPLPKEEEEGTKLPPPPPAPRKLLFEHFLVVGLPTDAKIESSRPTFHEPQILYQYPPDKKLVVSKIGMFCFPEGVKTIVARRTNSMSNLNEIYYGQSYLHSSESSYVFILTGIDNAYHYGVCVTKNELLREAPSFLQKRLPSTVGQRFIVAPRCYCLVSRYPFFSIHFEVLYSILAQERLLRLHRDYSANISSFPSTPVLPLPTQSSSAPSISTSSPVLSAVSTDPLLTPTDTALSYDPLTSNTIAPDQVSQGTGIPLAEEEEEKPTGWVDAIQILEKYYYTPVPEPGETTNITLPNGLQSISFSCPRGDTDAKVLADWCLACTFRILSLENLIRLFNSVMLEKQIIIVSKNLGLVTTIILSLVPLLRPLVWQGLLVPILPANMQDMVQAPVPFIVGMQALPERLKGQLEAFIIYLDTNEVVNPFPSTPLPEERKLQENLRQLHNLIYRPERINQNPLNISSAQQSIVNSLLASFNRYSSWFIESISSHYRSQLQGNSSATTDQIKSSFLQKISPHNRNFVECFLDTQHFSMFIDSVLRRTKSSSSSS